MYIRRKMSQEQFDFANNNQYTFNYQSIEFKWLSMLILYIGKPIWLWINKQQTFWKSKAFGWFLISIETIYITI